MAKRGRKKATELPEGPFCGAKSKRTGKPCTNQPMANGRCRLHGGKSLPPGPLNPNFIHGRYSKYLPESIRARVEEAAADPHLLSIRRQIEIVDVRFTMLLERLHSGESGSLWARLLFHKAGFQSAQAEIQRLKGRLQSLSPDDEAAALSIQNQIARQQQNAADALGSMMKIIDAGAKDESAWREMIDMAHELKDFKRAEIASEVQLRTVMTLDQAMMFVHNVQLAIADVVKEPKERAAIGLRLAQLLGPVGSSRPAGAMAVIEGPMIEGPMVEGQAVASGENASGENASGDGGEGVEGVASQVSPAPAGQGGAGERAAAPAAPAEGLKAATKETDEQRPDLW